MLSTIRVPSGALLRLATLFASGSRQECHSSSFGVGIAEPPLAVSALQQSPDDRSGHRWATSADKQASTPPPVAPCAFSAPHRHAAFYAHWVRLESGRKRMHLREN